MLESVREELSTLPSAERALDRSPRPAHKLKLLRCVLKRAKRSDSDWEEEDAKQLDASGRIIEAKTSDSGCDHLHWVEEAHFLASWPGGPLAWEFRLKGFPRDASFEFVRENFIAYAERVREGLQKQESRHGPTHKAKRLLILELSHIFDAYSVVRYEEDRQVLKAEFVAMALSAVGFQRPDPKKLRDRSTSRLARHLPQPCDGCMQGLKLTETFPKDGKPAPSRSFVEKKLRLQRRRHACSF